MNANVNMTTTDETDKTEISLDLFCHKKSGSSFIELGTEKQNKTGANLFSRFECILYQKGRMTTRNPSLELFLSPSDLSLTYT